jgi:hypothetical protein
MLEPLSQVPWKWEGLKSDCDDVLWTTTFNIQSTLHTIYIPTTTQARSTNNNTTTTQWPSTKLSSVEFCLHMTTTTLVFGRGLSYNRGGKLVCVKWWGPHAFQGSYVISTTLEGGNMQANFAECWGMWWACSFKHKMFSYIIVYLVHHVYQTKLFISKYANFRKKPR